MVVGEASDKAAEEQQAVHFIERGRVMSSFKGVVIILIFVLLGAVSLIAYFLNFLCGYRSNAKEGDACHHCEKGKFEVMPDVDFDSYPSMSILFSKEELMCTHCGIKDTSLNKW